MLRVNFKLVTIIGVLLNFISVVHCQTEDLKRSVLDSYRGFHWRAYQHNEQALYKVISEEAYRLLDERAQRVAHLETKDQWEAYRGKVRERLFDSMAKFQRTPLNAQVTGTLERPAFRVEKVLFESHPGFFVTACLFLPKERQKPAPAIIYCSGHTANGFRSGTYQLAILNLVKKGFVVLAFDPIGQGERGQYIDPETGKSTIGLGTKEHSYAGIQTLLGGTSLSDYFVWDGSRAVDYLLTRKEVDPERIGITGRSGGGTQSGMIAAYDERIFAAAPEAWMNNFKRLFQSIGPQDAEQNPYQIIKKGIDYPDYLHLRAPKPSLIITTDNDFFSIQGARETYREAQRSYEAFGAADHLQMTEDIGKHQSTQANREAMYAFFQKHLGLSGDPKEVEVEIFPDEALYVTETGQVATGLPSKTLYDLNRFYLQNREVTREQLPTTIRKLSGMAFDRQMTAAVYTGKWLEEDLQAEKYFLEQNKGDYVLPVITIRSLEKAPSKLLVWLHGEGKESLLKEEILPVCLAQGYQVIAADLPGIGALHDPHFSGDGFIDGVPNNYIFGAQMVGKSIAGIQAEAIDVLMQFVEEKNQAAQAIHVMADGGTGIALLHYTSQKNPFAKVAISGLPPSHLAFLNTENYQPQPAFQVVPGSVGVYDIEDLLSLLPFGQAKLWKKTSAERNSVPASATTNKRAVLNFLLAE